VGKKAPEIQLQEHLPHAPTRPAAASVVRMVFCEIGSKAFSVGTSGISLSAGSKNHCRAVRTVSHGPRQEKARRSVPARLSACFLFVDESRYTVNNSQVAFYSKGVPPPPRRMRLTKSREKSASIYATISSVCSKVRSSCKLMAIATSLILPACRASPWPPSDRACQALR
jgi:hypothetical protein